MMLITVIIGVLSYVCAYALYSYARSRAWRLPLQKYLSSWGMVSLMAALIWACGPWRLVPPGCDVLLSGEGALSYGAPDRA